MEATLPKPCLILAIWTKWQASDTVSVVIQSWVPQKSCCGIMLKVQWHRTDVESGDVLIRQNDHGVALQRGSQRVGQRRVHSLQRVGGALAIGFDEVWEDNVKVLRADCLPLLVGRVLSPEGGGQQDCQRHEMFHEAHEVRRKCNKLVALYYRLRKSEGSCKVCIFQILLNRTRNVEPWPGELSTSIVAPCELAMHFARERPKPNPKVRERALSAR